MPKLSLFLLAALFLSFADWRSSTGATAAGGETRPNIVVIVADDLGWNAVGYHDGFVPTPHIDRIASDGVELDRFYVSPMCSPTRAGLMTGRYALSLGMGRTVVRPWADYGLSPQERTLPEALADSGYSRRGAFGKWHLGHLRGQWHPLAQGFTEYVGCYNGAVDYWTREREGEIDWHVGDEPAQPEGYTTDLIAEAASDFIARSAGKGPFFCCVPFTAPHDPLQAPKKYLDKFAHLDGKPNDGKPGEKQRLAALIASMDDAIGKILAQLEESAVADNTIVWFCSDNGGIGGVRGNNAPLNGSKLTVYEGGVRVPAAVRWPGKIEGGRRIETPILNIDVMPTLLSLVRAEPAQNSATHDGRPIEGRDMSAYLLEGAPSQPPSRDLFFYHGQEGSDHEYLAVTTPQGWKLLIVGPDVRDGGYDDARHQVELYNVFRDPSETRNVADQKPKLVESLAAKLIAFRKSEPEGAMELTPRPKQFKPPANWRNAATPAQSDERQSEHSNAALQRKQPKLPDVVLFIADDLTWHDIGPYGGDDVQTPRLNQLATASLAFDNAFAASPTCTPSRSSMYTGLFPIRNGAHANHSRIKPDVKTLPSYLNELGYRTVLAGKTHIGPRRQFPFEYLKNSNVRPPGVNDVLLTDLGVEAIDELLATHDRTQPLCLIIAAHSSHTIWKKNESYDPAAIKIPPYLLDSPILRETRVDYYTDVTQLDAEVGQVLDSMERHGFGDALFMFTADQGSQFPFSKWNLYDAGIKVPLLVRWPGVTSPGERNDAIVSQVDFLPTIIEAGGNTAPAAIDGRSFLQVLKGQGDSQRTEVYAAHTGDTQMNQAPMRCIRTPRYKYIENLASDIRYTTHVNKGPTTQSYYADWVSRADDDQAAKQIVDRYERRPPEELYDLQADPFELTNLADDAGHAEIKSQLRERLHQWRKEQGEDLNTVLMPADAAAGRFPYAE
jgi:arylsulfatase A-like enzyme